MASKTKTKVIGSTEPAQPDTSVEETGRSRHSSREQEIRNRAYEIYLQRGGRHGFELEDWLQAEGELTTNSAWLAPHGGAKQA